MILVPDGFTTLTKNMLFTIRQVLSQRGRAVRRRSLRRSLGIHFRVSDTWVLGEAQVSVFIITNAVRQKQLTLMFRLYPIDLLICGVLHAILIASLNSEVTPMHPLPPKKMLIINILDILKRYSDEEHRLSQKDILEILGNEYSMTHQRKDTK